MKTNNVAADTNSFIKLFAASGKYLTLLRYCFRALSVIAFLLTGAFALKLIGAAGIADFLKMLGSALTFQVHSLYFSNGAIVSVTVIFLLYTVLTLTSKRWTLWLCDIAVLLSIIYFILGVRQLVFFKSMWIFMVAFWIVHRFFLGLNAVRREI
ncbi:MAG: hypothetical protein LBD73_04685 [Deferribacteraceae bacterium]|nr:hypothetical protein [Deferribacteraceae bacterium]